MKYILKRLVLGCPNIIMLTEDEHREAEDAHLSIIGVLKIEETYNLLLETYVDFEQELLNHALRKSAFQDFEPVSSIDEIQRLNLKLATFLMTVRLYMDQTPKNLVRLYGRRSGVVDKLNTAIEQERNSYFSFRLMEVLRNHTQHEDMPITTLEYGRSWKDKDNEVDKHIVFSTIPFVTIHDLNCSRSVDQGLKQEIETKPNKTDIRPFIREYMESIGRVHNFVRIFVAQDIHKWHSLLNTLQERYKVIDPNELVGLGVIVTDDSGSEVKRFYLNNWPYTRLEWLQQRNRLYNRFSEYTVSNEL